MNKIYTAKEIYKVKSLNNDMPFRAKHIIVRNENGLLHGLLVSKDLKETRLVRMKEIIIDT